MQSAQRPRMHACRPIQERILDAALHVKYGCGARQHGIYQSKLTQQEQRGVSGMRLQPSGVVVVWKYHDVVPPQPAVPVRI
jgi:hypothetical protein